MMQCVPELLTKAHSDVSLQSLYTPMETQKGPHKDYSPKKGAIWDSMLVWGSVCFLKGATAIL